MKKSNGKEPNSNKPDGRGKIKSDFPKHSLEDALRVAQSISDKNGGQPLPPTETAIAIGVSPGSSEFRTLLSSSIKYGLTSGSFNSERVALEEAGRNIVEPRTEEDERRALVAAALAPSTFRAVYDYFKGKKLPDDQFFQNTLVREFDVPREHAAKCAAVFVRNVERVGLVRTASTGKWLSTDIGATGAAITLSTGQPEEEANEPLPPNVEKPAVASSPQSSPAASAPVHVAKSGHDQRLSRVFITHGKNTAFISPIKDLLSFGQLEPVVSVEKESVAQPVPDKVLNDMRSCGAAIIHVDGEMKLIDDSAKEHVMLNPNVLIEIGAAMALYGRRFILLVRDGVKLPSNLQGLYEVRYDGDKLDGEVTIRLLRAINELKAQPLPA